MKNLAVLGLGFGDEGKGMVVDRLASRRPNHLNVRFSGGHQVGHTVVSKEKGVRHVFSNFGSATLRGVPTRWMRKCVVCPTGMVNEHGVLRDKGVFPSIGVHPECPVATPMDREANRALSASNGHGTCGVGFGATLQREKDFYSLKFVDLFYPSVLEERLRNIAAYYGKPKDFEGRDEFLEACARIRHGGWARLIDDEDMVEEDSKRDGYLFEGSQGMMLDQRRGFFPNVTRSNTGSSNLRAFMDDTDWFLVTRAYQTRHGNGFMTNEGMPHNIKADPEETNVRNEWQGEFRRSLLDVSLLEYALRRDELWRIRDRCNLVVTCMDHVECEHRFTYDGQVVCCGDAEEFVERVARKLGVGSSYASFSADGNNWRRITGRGGRTGVVV